MSGCKHTTVKVECFRTGCDATADLTIHATEGRAGSGASVPPRWLLFPPPDDVDSRRVVFACPEHQEDAALVALVARVVAEAETYVERPRPPRVGA